MLFIIFEWFISLIDTGSLNNGIDPIVLPGCYLAFLGSWSLSPRFRDDSMSALLSWELIPSISAAQSGRRGLNAFQSVLLVHVVVKVWGHIGPKWVGEICRIFRWNKNRRLANQREFRFILKSVHSHSGIYRFVTHIKGLLWSCVRYLVFQR